MKNKKLILIIIATFILNISALLGCLSLFSMVKNQRESAKGTIKNSSILKKKIQEVKLLESQIDKIKEDKKKIDSIFLMEEDIVKFIETLEDLGKKTGILIKISSAEIGKGSENPKIRISANGSFQNIFHYILLLENMPNQIVFDNLNLVKKASDSEKKGEWEADIEISIKSFLNKNND